MAATISLAVVTGGDGDRVHALLAAMRPHVDEIVLGIDAGGHGGIAERCAHLADRCYTFDRPETGSAVLAHALEQCSTDWILRLDDDETPSRTLIDSLPELIDDRQVSQIVLKRRWLWPDGRHYIRTFPWGFEPAPRLTRNVRGTWRIGGGVHSDERVIAGEWRLVDVAFYHGDLLLGSEEQRRRKVEHYERLAPGLRYGHVPINAIYLPEDAQRLDCHPLPDGDVALVEAMLRPPSVPIRPVKGLQHATEAQVTRPNLDRAVSASAYEAALTLPDPPDRLPAAAIHHLELVAHNHGDEIWPAGDVGARPIRVGYRWRRTDAGEVVSEGRDLFTETVRPGTTTRMTLTVHTPLHPGHHVLEVDVVHEHVRWFGHPVQVGVDIVATHGETQVPEETIRPRPPTHSTGVTARIRPAVLAPLRRRWRRLRG